MLTGKVFSKVTSYLGIAGSALILLYIVLVTFAPNIKDMATAFCHAWRIIAHGLDGYVYHQTLSNFEKRKLINVRHRSFRVRVCSEVIRSEGTALGFAISR